MEPAPPPGSLTCTAASGCARKALEFREFLQAHVENGAAQTPAGVRRWLTLTPAVLLCLSPARWRAPPRPWTLKSGVDDDLRDNVLAYLSFERYRKGGAELTPDTVERLHERVGARWIPAATVWLL